MPRNALFHRIVEPCVSKGISFWVTRTLILCFWKLCFKFWSLLNSNRAVLFKNTWASSKMPIGGHFSVCMLFVIYKVYIILYRISLFLGQEIFLHLWHEMVSLGSYNEIEQCQESLIILTGVHYCLFLLQWGSTYTRRLAILARGLHSKRIV